ncbi:MAG: S24 family peptidase [Bacteroidota bacterium]
MNSTTAGITHFIHFQKSSAMLTFERCQTVPVVSLCDMNPHVATLPKTPDFPILGDTFHFLRLDLSLAQINNPADTYFVQHTDDSMVGEGIGVGSILVVDCSAKPEQGRLVIAFVEGMFVLRRIFYSSKGVVLKAANANIDDMHLPLDMTFGIWGVVRDVLGQAAMAA